MIIEDVATVRLRIAETAAQMLDGSIEFLEGVRLLTGLRSKADIKDDDEDFSVLDDVDSETDGLPLGDVRRHWATEALERLDPEIEAATAWAKQFASGACESLLARFGG
jgi:hypothetical protein